MNTTEHLLVRLCSALGISVLALGCADKESADESTTVATEYNTDFGPECSTEVEQTVCVPAVIADGGGPVSTGDSTTAAGGSSTGSEGSGSSTSSGDTTGSPGGSSSTGPIEPGQTDGSTTCSQVEPPNVGFCVLEKPEVVEQDGECCFTFRGYQECCEGRPFVVNERLRLAPVVDREDWGGPVDPRLDGLGASVRVELAEAWAEDARMEHASVASFSRFVLHLLALGSPPSLLVEAQQALADEIEHARVCFGLASAYAGRPVGPGPLSVEGALPGPITLVDAAVAALREGCIGETLAAHQAEMAALQATEPTVRAALVAIADDEARHAELAWRFVAWAIERGGDEVRYAVANALEAAWTEADEPVGPPPADPVSWHAHGRLTPAEIAEVRARGMREIVLPCARALLAPGGAARAVDTMGENLA